MNKTLITVAEPSDIHWDSIGQDAVVLLDCTEPACSAYGTQHLMEWGDLVKHSAFVAQMDEDTLIEVLQFPACDEVSPRESRWYVAGFITDDWKRLTPERVSFFNAHYNSAVALAAELNGEVA